jgi:hypothetical protein
MTTNDIRIFADVTARRAEEAFHKQMDESDRRIEAQVKATRLRYAEKSEVRSSVSCGGRSSATQPQISLDRVKERNA